MDEPLACEVVHPGCHLLAEAQQQLWPLWPRQLPRTERERKSYRNIVCIIRDISSIYSCEGS